MPCCQLKDESYSEPLAPDRIIEDKLHKEIFADRHTKVTNVIFVHQDLVGGSVMLQILRRYLRENKPLGSTAVQTKEKRPKLKIFIKRMTFKQIKSLSPVPNPCWLTLIRDPHQRALSLYKHVAASMLPHIQRQGIGPGLRTDDDTTTGHHATLLAAFVRQDPATLERWPQLRYVAQWTSWADSPAEAVSSAARCLAGASQGPVGAQMWCPSIAPLERP